MMADILDSAKSGTLAQTISLENQKRKNKLNEMWQRIETVMQP